MVKIFREVVVRDGSLSSIAYGITGLFTSNNYNSHLSLERLANSIKQHLINLTNDPERSEKTKMPINISFAQDHEIVTSIPFNPRECILRTTLTEDERKRFILVFFEDINKP